MAREDPTSATRQVFHVIAERDLDAERAISSLTAACQMLFRGHDATSLALARLPLRNGAMPRRTRLVERAQERHVGQPDHPLAAASPAMAAQLLLGAAV